VSWFRVSERSLVFAAAVVIVALVVVLVVGYTRIVKDARTDVGAYGER